MFPLTYCEFAIFFQVVLKIVKIAKWAVNRWKAYNRNERCHRWKLVNSPDVRNVSIVRPMHFSHQKLTVCSLLLNDLVNHFIPSQHPLHEPVNSPQGSDCHEKEQSSTSMVSCNIVLMVLMARWAIFVFQSMTFTDSDSTNIISSFNVDSCPFPDSPFTPYRQACAWGLRARGIRIRRRGTRSGNCCEKWTQVKR